MVALRRVQYCETKSVIAKGVSWGGVGSVTHSPRVASSEQAYASPTHRWAAGAQQWSPCARNQKYSHRVSFFFTSKKTPFISADLFSQLSLLMLLVYNNINSNTSYDNNYYNSSKY